MSPEPAWGKGITPHYLPAPRPTAQSPVSSLSPLSSLRDPTPAPAWA